MALDAHHANARKLVLTVNEQLQALESGQDTSVGLQSLISQNLNALAREVQELEGLLAAVAPGSRGLWRKKITQLTDESASLRHALGKYASSRSAQQRELEEREALLAGGRGGGEHAIDINGFAAHESRRLHESDSAIDGLTGNATAVLDQLGQQRGALKGVHKRVLDLATTLGVSNSVMKMIERRQFLDKLLVYGGMLAVLALLWFVHRVRSAGGGEEGES
jgi:Golgi SNAP receptor complex protein 2